MADWRRLLANGKLIGGGAGLLLGGPIGAVVGLVAGHAYDTWRGERARLGAAGAGRAGTGGGAGPPSGAPFGDPLAARRTAFATAVIALAAKLAKADGVVTADEIRAFKRTFVIQGDQGGMVARIYNEAKRTAEGFETHARRAADLFRHDPAVLEQLLTGLFAIAGADGRVNDAELRFLREVGRIFGFTGAAFDAVRARFEAATGQGDDPYAVLGVARGATADEIKRAYRDLVREHHPDRLVAKGMPAEFVAQANRKLAAINAAYDRLAREQGLR